MKSIKSMASSPMYNTCYNNVDLLYYIIHHKAPCFYVSTCCTNKINLAQFYFMPTPNIMKNTDLPTHKTTTHFKARVGNVFEKQVLSYLLK